MRLHFFVAEWNTQRAFPSTLDAEFERVHCLDEIFGECVFSLEAWRNSILGYVRWYCVDSAGHK